MQTVWAETALTSNGWEKSVQIQINEAGEIISVSTGQQASGQQVGILLPAPVNLHSHAFQRAIAGLTERPGPAGTDSFWTWRQEMYRFVQSLYPEDIEAISALVQMESLEAGFAGIVEFHYLHHQPDGSHFERLNETSTRIVSAAEQTGIGLTLLPVLYQQAGCDGAPLSTAQRGFGNTIDSFAAILDACHHDIQRLSVDANLGVAAHSLRAVNQAGLKACIDLADAGPIHIHVAEQTAEIQEVQQYFGARPVEWLLDNADIDERWCLVHATHITDNETISLAQAGAVAGFCPVTEANLGDGVFPGVRYLGAGGKFGIGTDSNVRISLAGELSMLEYSQRLSMEKRVLMSKDGQSVGRTLLEDSAKGGASAASRNSGVIEVGKFADLLALDSNHISLMGRTEDQLIDSFVFSTGGTMVSDVWAAGRHVVRDGKHINRSNIENEYRKTIFRLGNRI